MSKAVAYFKCRERKPNSKNRKSRSGTSLLTCTFYAEPDGIGKVEPIHRKREETRSRQLKRFAGGVKNKEPTMTEPSWAKILIQSVPRRTAGFVTTSVTVRRQIAMNRKKKHLAGPWSPGKPLAARASFSCSWSKIGLCPVEEWHCLRPLLWIWSCDVSRRTMLKTKGK